MAHRTRTYLIFAALASTALVGCQHMPVAELDRPLLTPEEVNAPHMGDGGVVIAQTTIVGPAEGLGADLSATDCDGGGFGVKVDTTLEGKNYVFDKNGKPCPKAQTLFDGSQKVFQRAPSESVTIGFVDQYGSIKPQKPNEWDNMVVVGDMDENVYPEDFALTGEEMLDIGNIPEEKKTDILKQSIEQMRIQTEKEQLLKDAEKLLAEHRNIGRLSSDELVRAHQDQIQHLLAQLRSAERELRLEKERRAQLTAQSREARGEADAERIAREQEERKLKATLDDMHQRVSAFEQANRELKYAQAEQEQTHKQRMAKVTHDLRAAEREADSARQQLVLEAAQKIAEAERLAFEARMAKRDMMERKAERLRMEAENMMKRSVDLSQGHQIVVPAFSSIDMPRFESWRAQPQTMPSGAPALPKTITPIAQAGAPEKAPEAATHQTLEEMTVTIREEDKTLQNVFESVFGGLEDRAGAWEVVWQLKSANMALPHEKWTVIAEAPLADFLSYVREKVGQTHGVQLKFRRFDGSNLFVVSDE